LVLKLLAGRLYEASRLIASHYFAKGLDKKYEKEMSEKARDARRPFNAYFGGKGNVITSVRQRFAFHHHRDEMKAVYNELSSGSNLTFGTHV
jgi:hypothetical protein